MMKYYFFLQKSVTLFEGPTFETFSFECLETQVVQGSDKTLYNLETRHWFRGPKLIYNIQKVIHYHNTDTLSVFFVLRDAKTYAILEKKDTIFDIDKELQPKPLWLPIDPREDAIEKFTKFHYKQGKKLVNFSPDHVRKLFKTFQLSALQSIEVHGKVEGRKPVHKGLLQRMLQSMKEMWETSDDLREMYSLEPWPVCIIDQRLDLPDRDPEAVGNILVIFSLKHPTKKVKSHTFRW